MEKVISPKKLIEVALPLDAINAASAREKSIRYGHPSTLHLWWARRPLAAARAVIFSQLVNDPEDLWRCQNPGQEPNSQVKGHWTKARARLFSIIEDLVKWENTTNERVLEKAREEIRSSWRVTCELNKQHSQADKLFNPDKMPGLLDPFAGGGAIPLEAQRLGLDAIASDLNPVAVLINKAMIEIPSRFANLRPVRPESHSSRAGKLGLEESWKCSAGLAEDVRHYGQWIRDEAFKRIGHLYPPIEVTLEMVKDRPDLEPQLGHKLTVIAWIWARTVKSPNPAFSHLEVPLASTFVLCSKSGNEAYVQPVIEKNGYSFKVNIGKSPLEAKAGTKSARGANFRCIMSQVPIEPDYIKEESVAERMGAKLMAIVADGKNGRVYLSPSNDQESIAKAATPGDAAAMIHVPLANDPRNLWCLQYGLDHFDKLFTPRQLVAMTTFSDLVGEIRKQIQQDAVKAGLGSNGASLEDDGCESIAYADAISVYLGMAVSRSANTINSLAVWSNSRGQSINLFSRQAIPMNWDYPEVNPFAGAAGDFGATTSSMAKTLASFSGHRGMVLQRPAQEIPSSPLSFISTDPPYYDNVAYADLSDFFYVWLRRSLRDVYPSLMSTISVPKAEELVASPYRQGTKERAERFFLEGMTQVMKRLSETAHPSSPITIYYAFKQSESKDTDGTSSTGWVTFLEAVLRAGMAVHGTWPMKTERPEGVKTGTNVLASSIILVCRPRHIEAEEISRRQFIRELNSKLPLALDAMTRESEGLHSPVAPVDLSQAIIGPGMSIFSKYSAVLEADGSPMTVKVALKLINRFLAEDDFDAETQFCLRWFEQHHWDAGQFGEADVLARAKGTSVDGVKQAGVISSASGKVQLYQWPDYPTGWQPETDSRLPIWETLHQMIRVFRHEGESAAGAVLAKVPSKAEPTRQLAYRLYTLCERAGLAEDARAYNELITSWTGIESAASEPKQTQRTLFDN